MVSRLVMVLYTLVFLTGLGGITRAGAADPAQPPVAKITFDVKGTDASLGNKALFAAIGDGTPKDYFSEQAGRKCWTVPAVGAFRYLYVKVNDPHLTGGSMRVRVTLTALDKPGYMEIHYDSYLFPWKTASQPMTGSGHWKTFIFDLPDAAFEKRCNGYDFRFTAIQSLTVAEVRVELIKRELPPDDFPREFSLETLRKNGPDHRGFAFGGANLSDETFDREMRLTKELGCGWVRNFLEWGNLEPEKGKFDWTTMDTRLALAKKHGLKMLGMLGYCAPWAADAPDTVQGWGRGKYPPKDLGDFARYVKAVVSRYKKDIKYWEGWNEHQNVGGFWKLPASTPNRDPAEHFVALQRVMYESAKKADPTCVVLTGSFADDSHLAAQIADRYDKGLKGTFDVMNIHIYGADPRGGWETGQIQSVIRIMRHYGDGDKKIWITETGWATARHELKKTHAQQAEWAPWAFAVPLTYPQVERVFFYELRDREANSVDFGWYDLNFKPRPVVARWQELLKTLKPSKIRGEQ